VKKNLAYSSGMRGSEIPSIRQADDEAAEGEAGIGTESSEKQDTEELGTTVAEHIHVDPETGHHHLNLTSLAATLGKKKGGEHDE
jgi:hypothetical protein